MLALMLPAVAAAQEPISTTTSDRYYVYQLNHIAMSDAIKILKTLNYQVVDAGTAIGTDRPVVVPLPDSEETSIVTGKVSLDGGNKLKGPPAGAPLQRLLIVWDGEDPGPLATLLRLLYERIDLAARQIRIEALILELDRDKFKDLGVSFEGSKDGQTFSFSGDALTPFTYIFSRPSAKTLLDLQVSISALVRNGNATVLSQPSVLVLDGRQARIRVGDKIPYTEILSSALEATSQIVSSTSWAETGIALNLRPRRRRPTHPTNRSETAPCHHPDTQSHDEQQNGCSV